MTQTVKNLPAMQEPQADPWVRKIPRERNGYPLQYSCMKNSMQRTLVDYSPWDHKESYITKSLKSLYCFTYSTLSVS